MVNHGCNNVEVLRDFLEKHIKELYGQEGRGIGPFSICSYFEHLFLGGFDFFYFDSFYVGCEDYNIKIKQFN